MDDRVIGDVGDSGLVNDEWKDVITSCVLGGSEISVTPMHEGRLTSLITFFGRSPREPPGSFLFKRPACQPERLRGQPVGGSR